MSNEKESTKKRDVYKESRVGEGDIYKIPKDYDPILAKLKTSVIPRDGYRVYWARESDIRGLMFDGYKVANAADYPQICPAFVDEDDRTRSTVRLPTKDSNEDLVLMEIPLAVFNKRKAEEEVELLAIDKQMQRRSTVSPEDGVYVTSNMHTKDGDPFA